MATDARCTTAVATVMPISTGIGLNRVAKVSAISWDLSPSSATKMTPKLTTSAAKNPSMTSFPFMPGGGTGAPSTRLQQPESKVSPASETEAAWPDAERTSMSTTTLGATPLRAVSLSDHRPGPVPRAGWTGSPALAPT